MKTFSRSVFGLAIVAVLGAAPASGQKFDRPMAPAFLKAMEPMVLRDAPSSRIVTTAHRGSFAGKAIAYDAIVTETPVANAAGETAAIVVTYGYVAKDAGDPDRRPVLFIFNGGPGASSSPLHMNAFGPRIIAGEGASAKLANNEHSLLDSADLVFIDPPGTGASMPIAGSDPSSLFSVSGDAKAVADTIHAWLVRNGRTGSPYALVGESYGTARALAILHEQMKAEQRLPEGVALLSMSLGDTSGPVIEDVTLLPTLAAVAWYHGAVDRSGQTVEDWYAAALSFAQGDYASALIRGPSLEPADKRAIADRMAGLIGIPAEQLMASDLKLDKSEFMLGLLSSQALRTGQLDARVTRGIADSDFQPPFDDPSMTLGAGTSEILERYLSDDLGYRVPSPYRSLNLGVNFQWSWGQNESYRSARFAPYLAQALTQKPAMSVFTAGGYYDITTPAYAGIFALDQAGIAPEKRTTRLYAAGHSVFEDADGLEQISADMRVWAKNLNSGD